ncbi:hypothetical protein HPL003_17815 [Paenibacillus terrae HPL-003]|uniref:Uncharacterized protein n=1 Tax=Paenibacillus terrae (strain HPL-003) TaxID=985665 RepID=G7W0Y0_PAETH|nr:hypothetical protein HPL003_17815 [Paenibacillus terrae HPL-003]
MHLFVVFYLSMSDILIFNESRNGMNIYKRFFRLLGISYTIRPWDIAF